MKKMFAIAAAAVALATVPAQANEARVELRGGVAWANETEAFAGVGAGYDFDLGDKAFAGLDAGADKVLVDGAEVLWSVGGRIGAKVGTGGKLYALGGVGFCCGEQDAYAGAGYQHALGQKAYVKVEYRNVFNDGDNINFAGVGVGVRF